MPMADAICRFCVTARMRSPKGVSRSSACNAPKTASEKTMIHMRPCVMDRPPSWSGPDMKPGAPTSLLLAPKTVRTICWRISDTP